MKTRQILGMLLCVCVLFGVMAAVPAHASEAAAAPAQSSNLGNYEYSYDRWANPIKSYLVPHADGTLTRVEYAGETIVAETYDSDLNFVSGTAIDMELPLFGGFYYGETCNFLVFGQENPNEDDAVEVIRVVSYTRDWQRIGAASLCGANTSIPFDAGSLRFAEYNGYLYIRTAHEMYASDDGVNHQANLTLNVRIADMVITDSFYDVMNVNYGYVSHSFNQFIAIDGTDIVAVDHGDAHPRSVVLIRYCAPAGQDSFMEYTLKPTGNGYYTYVYSENVDVLPIAGSTGANDTGVSLGGFEISSSAYLIAGNTVSHGDDYDAFGQRNIFVSATSKEDFSADGTTINYLTDYAEGDGVTLSNPQFAKVGDDRYAVIWTEETADGSTMRYAFVDGSGALIGEIYSAAGVLSDCKPVVSGNKLVWYVTSASAPAFFTIDLEDPANVTADHIYVYEYSSYPSYSRAGALSSTCAVCGEQGPDVEIPAIKNADAYTLVRYTEEPTCTTDGYAYFRWNDIEKYGVTLYNFGAKVLATGHSWKSGTCTTCGAVCEHSFVDGICQTCGVYALQHVGATLTLESEVKYNLYFYLNTSDVSVTDVGLLTFLTEPADATVENASYVLNSLFYDQRLGYYALETQGVPAKEMGDSMYLRLYARLEDGSILYGKLISYSAKTYAVNTLKKTSSSAELKNTVVALMNYGAEAQKLFDHDVENLMNAGLSAEQVAYSAELLNGLVKADGVKAGSLTAAAGAFTDKRAGVTLSGALAINYFFLPGKTVDNGTMTMYYWTAATYASVEELTLENADGSTAMTPNGSYYEGVVKDIAAKEIDDTVYVLAVYESGGETCMSGIVSYSVEQYCRSQAAKAGDNQKMCEALTIYSYYAKIYFGEDQE